MRARCHSPCFRLLPMLTAAWLVGAATAAAAQTGAEQLAACYAEGEPVAKRLAACSRAIEQATDSESRAEAFLQRGVLQEFAGEREAAVKDYTEVIKLDPGNAVAFFNRGNTYDQLGQH